MPLIVSLLLFALVAFVAPALARRWGARVFWLLAAVPAGVFAYTLTLAPTIAAGGVVVENLPWIPQLGVSLSFRMDSLALVLALVVTGVGALVLWYCRRYFSDTEPGLGRFAACLVLFAGVMYGLVTSDDVIVLVVFWELTSVLSFLLIGHYSGRRESRGAAVQALVVTTLGGLTMMVGVVMLAVEAGTTSLSEIVAQAPTGTYTVVAIVLVLVGALSKSALFPFHFWLPAAMAAPTPVSAYLHAAAMVKAGIYLVARLAPGFADLPGWAPIIVLFGGWTMLIGGWRSLRQNDLKLVLAHGTVSQLGFLTMLVGLGTGDLALAGIAMLVAHALFKATLFLVVGVIDHDAGTRDLRGLSGVGRRRPGLLVLALVAGLSMIGIPPALGFVGKEAALAGLLDAAPGQPWAVVSLVAVVLGSVLTTAYTLRFLWGAFADKRELEPTISGRTALGLFAPMAVLVGATLVLGVWPAPLEEVAAPYADTVGHGVEAHFALWHGWEPALFLSMVIVAAGAVLFVGRKRVARIQRAVHVEVDASSAYARTVGGVDRLSAAVSALVQRGGLTQYLSTILVVFVALLGGALLLGGFSLPVEPVLWDYPVQVAVGLGMAIAAIGATLASRRIAAALLAGVTGYGMAILFAFHGAPDLALTQALVETITIVVVVLVIRRLPSRMPDDDSRRRKALRALLSVAVAAVITLAAAVALSARERESISAGLPELSEQAHGKNIVNVMLVDIRAWDTMGEISVLVVVATGIASLMFVAGRLGGAPREESVRRQRAERRLGRPVVEPVPPQLLRPGQARDTTRNAWLLAGRTLAPGSRSIMLEVVVRILFHPTILVSLFLLFAGHNQPGGGFAGGLLASLALTARYLAAGRYELGEAAPVPAGFLLGTGIALSAGCAAVAVVFGAAPLESAWLELPIPVLGEISIGTSTIFDIGVYLVVVGLALDVLRSLGAEIDRQQEEGLDSVPASAERTAGEGRRGGRTR